MPSFGYQDYTKRALEDSEVRNVKRDDRRADLTLRNALEEGKQKETGATKRTQMSIDADKNLKEAQVTSTLQHGDYFQAHGENIAHDTLLQKKYGDQIVQTRLDAGNLLNEGSKIANIRNSVDSDVERAKAGTEIAGQSKLLADTLQSARKEGRAVDLEGENGWSTISSKLGSPPTTVEGTKAELTLPPTNVQQVIQNNSIRRKQYANNPDLLKQTLAARI